MNNFLQLQTDRAFPFSALPAEIHVLLPELLHLLLDLAQCRGMPGFHGSDCRLETFSRHHHFRWESYGSCVHSNFASVWRHDVSKARFILRVIQEIIQDFLRRLSFRPSSPPLDRLEWPLVLSIGEPVLCATATKAVCVESIVSVIHDSSIHGVFVQ